MIFCNVQVSRYLNFEVFVLVLVNTAVFRNATHCRSLPQSQWKMCAYKGKDRGGRFFRNCGIYLQNYMVSQARRQQALYVNLGASLNKLLNTLHHN